MNSTEPDPRFLSPAGERSWTWLRRHLDRARAFWLGFVFTGDRIAEQILRERAQSNRRLRVAPFVVLEPASPEELAGLLDILEERGAPPPGCTWVAANHPGAGWVDAWTAFLRSLNHRRDHLRERLGGLVLVAPPAAKPAAQLESPDLWSVRDLFVELPTERAPTAALPREPASTRSGADMPRRDHARGQSIADVSDEALDEVSALLALPRGELATTARARAAVAVESAIADGSQQTAAVLLLAMAEGYAEVGDAAGGLDLARDALRFADADEQTRIGALDLAAKLATDVSDYAAARRFAADSVTAVEGKATRLDTPEALRDLCFSLTTLGDIDRDTGNLDAARTAYTRSLELRERLATQLGTPEALRDLSISLDRVGDLDQDTGNLDAARTAHTRALDLRERLATQLGTPQALRDLSYSLGRVAEVQQLLGQHDEADSARRRAEEVDAKLALLEDN